MLKSDFELFNKIFETEDLGKFIISNKLLNNDFFGVSKHDVIDFYKTYVGEYNLHNQSVTKNVNSFTNFEICRYYEPYCYHIKDIEPKQVYNFLNESYNTYKQLNKYSSLNGFIQNSMKYKMLDSKLKYLNSLLKNGKIHQPFKNKNLNIFLSNHLSLTTFYTSYLNIYELSEYINLLLNEINEFSEKHQQKNFLQNLSDDINIIAQLLATNEIQIIGNEYKFKGKTYPNANQLNKAINESFDFEKNYIFNQYLTNFKDKDGDKYLLETKDINGQPNKTSINRLRKIKDYFETNNIEVLNKDFLKVFKKLDNN